MFKTLFARIAADLFLHLVRAVAAELGALPHVDKQAVHAGPTAVYSSYLDGTLGRRQQL